MTLLYHPFDFSIVPLASESLPLINLFMANFSRNHIVDKSTILKTCFQCDFTIGDQAYYV